MLSNEEFNRALQLAGDRQEQGGQAIKVNTPRFNREETIGDLKEGIGRFRDTYKELFTGVAEPAKQFVTGQESFPEAKQQAKNAMGKAAVDTLDNIYTTTLKAVATQEEEDVTVETIQNAMIALGVDKMVEKYQTFKDDLPTPTRTDLDSFELALETGLNFAPVKGFGVGKRAIDTTVDTARAAGARVHEISPAFIRNNLRRAETEGGVNFAVQATDDLEKAFKMSFVDDTPAVLNKLERVASRNRVDGTTVRAEDLVRELAEAQVFPRVDGEVARFDDFFNYIEKQEAEVGSAINRRLEQVPTKTSLSEIKNTALQNLRNDPYAAPDLVRTENQIEQLFAGLARKYGDNLSATQVNEVRKQMNRRSKAYNKEEFEIDAQAAVGNAARQRIDKISGSTAVREANGYLAKMYKQRDIAEVFHNRKIATNEVLDSLGSWMGTLAASTIGFSMAGPGGLVIAGVAARLGSKALANILRRMRFGSKDQKMIVEAIKKDPYAVRKLIDEADGEDKALLERLLLPAPSGQTPIEVGPRGSTRPDTTSVKAVPADKQVVRGEKGRFATGYTSEPKGTEAARIRQQIEDNLNVSSSPSITDNKQGGFASFFGGNSKNPRAKALRDYISQQEKQLRGIEARGKTDSTAYKNIQKTIGEAKRMLDEAQGKAKSATTKTTDLPPKEFVKNSVVKTPLYHSGPEGITEFKVGSSGGTATYGEGIYLSPSKVDTYTNQGANKTYEVYADIRNPLDIEKVDEETWLQFIQQSTPEKKRAWLEKRGYDAVIDLEEGGNNEIMVLRPEQLKIVDQTTDLLEEARPYFADPRKIPKTEQEFIEAHTIYHGANTKFADQLEKTKSFKPGAKREAGTGGNLYGLSATTDARMAQDFSTSATGEGRVVELYIDPKAKVLNMRSKALDDLTEAETRKLAKEYDVIRDIDNVGGENEVRILNPDILRDKSQIESAWVLQDTGITDLYKEANQ